MTTRQDGDFWSYCANGAACPGSKDGVGRRFATLKRQAGSKSAGLCSKCAAKADVLALTEDDPRAKRTFTGAHVALIRAGESKSDWVRSEKPKAQGIRGKAEEAPKAKAPRKARPKAKSA